MTENLTEKYLDTINRALAAYLPESDGAENFMNDVMAYSLQNGGKRIRPMLTMEFCALCGKDAASALPFACAVEYVHTYSLIHDDLPCMDNDDMRRGKPASHIRFGEANALLGGDGLLTMAFGILAAAELPPALIVRAVDALADAAGVCGMIGGQYLDLAGETEARTADDLRATDALKTGALIRCACVLGCIAADADYEQIEAAELFAENLGVAFQIIDDVLDVTSDVGTLGKPVGSDEKNGKSTYVSLLGPEQAKAEAVRYTQKAIDALAVFGDKADALTDFARALAERIN